MTEPDPIEDRLHRSSPAPGTAWRHQLRRELQSGPLPPRRPARLWALIVASGGAGCALLLVGALLV
jgi:hypothetical protein